MFCYFQSMPDYPLLTAHPGAGSACPAVRIGNGRSRASFVGSAPRPGDLQGAAARPAFCPLLTHGIELRIQQAQQPSAVQRGFTVTGIEFGKGVNFQRMLRKAVHRNGRRLKRLFNAAAKARSEVGLAFALFAKDRTALLCRF